MSPRGRRAASGRLARVAALACAATLLASCSIVKLGYRNADSFTLRWLDRYVGLDEVQDAFAWERVRDFYTWHRATQLPDYVKWLQGTQDILRQQSVTPAEVLAVNAGISARLDTAAMKALPDLAQLTLQLQPRQIDAIESRFAKNNADFRKEFLDVDIEQRQVSRYKTVLWIAEVLFGRLTAEQQAQIRRASDARPLVNEAWMAERLGRQRDLIAVLRRIEAEKPPVDAVVALLASQVVRATGIAHIPDAATRAQAELAAAHAAQLSATIVNMTTPEQKERAIGKLRGWADDLRDLSR